jgi:thermosome
LVFAPDATKFQLPIAIFIYKTIKHNFNKETISGWNIMSDKVQPIFIMPEGTQRNSGRSAQRNNILAAKLVAETVRTTLGPKGMDKMIVDSLGDVTVTNDGVTILEEIHIEHPIGKMIVEIARTQDSEVGDGTTTAVVLAGELLKNAEDLLDKEVHPTIIVKGYRMAAEKAQQILNDIAEEIGEKDIDLLRKIAITAVTGKGAESAKDTIADLTVKAVKMISWQNGNVSREDIRVEKKVGGGIENSELVAGIVLEKEKVHSEMPSLIKNAKILLIDCPIEIKSTEIDAKIEITDPSQMQAFLDQEEKMLKAMVAKIVNSGANAVFCQKGIDDVAQYFLAKQGLFAARRLKQSDMEALARATGAKILSNLEDIKKEDLGFAGTVEEVKFGNEEMIYVRECKNPRAVTILVRGGTEHVVAEVKRAITDAIGDVVTALKTKQVVAGAGAPEIEVAKGLRKFADSLSGREQLAVLAFADAIEVIPRTLAENAGLDPIDVLTDLKSQHDKKNKWAGIDVFTGKVVDAWKHGVIEPLKIKTQAIQSASEVACLILRIDDVIAGGKEPPQGPSGMAGMPQMM